MVFNEELSGRSDWEFFGKRDQELRIALGFWTRMRFKKSNGAQTEVKFNKPILFRSLWKVGRGAKSVKSIRPGNLATKLIRGDDGILSQFRIFKISSLLWRGETSKENAETQNCGVILRFSSRRLVRGEAERNCDVQDE